MKRKRLAVIATVLCYALSYATVIALAASKKIDLGNTYNYAFWLLGASVVFFITAIPTAIISVCVPSPERGLNVIFFPWIMSIAVFGFALIVSST